MDSSGSEEIIFWFKGIGEYNTWLPPSVPVSGMHRAVLEGDFLNVKRWIESGESVNKQESQSNLSALHMAVVENDLEILECLLARDDIEIDIRLCKGKIPLNLATLLGYMESVEKLVQAGSDVNIPDYEYNTPLHMSVYCPDHSEQCALLACLHNPVDLDTFKLVWERLRYSDSRTAINMFDFFHYDLPTYLQLQVVIDSDNFDPVVKFFSAWSNYHAFICELAERQLDVEQLICLTCRLLQYGYRPCNYDIHAIFCLYGYCELLRILLYMDNDIEEGCEPHMAISKLIYDISYSVELPALFIMIIPL